MVTERGRACLPDTRAIFGVYLHIKRVLANFCLALVPSGSGESCVIHDVPSRKVVGDTKVETPESENLESSTPAHLPKGFAQEATGTLTPVGALFL